MKLLPGSPFQTDFDDTVSLGYASRTIALPQMLRNLLSTRRGMQLEII